jgi:hypothetical protein
MTDTMLTAAKAEWSAWAWTNVVLVHHEAAIELDQARATRSGEADNEVTEELAATIARYAKFTRILWLFGKIVDKPQSSVAWTPALDSVLLDYADALMQQQTALVGLQFAIRNRPVQLRNAMMARDLPAIEQLAAATVDADKDAWTSVHLQQRLSPALAAYRDAAAVEHRLAQAVAAHVATDLRHQPLVDLDKLMCQARHGDGGPRLGIGTGHEIRAAAPDEILIDSNTSTRPDVVAATPAMTMFPDATFRDVICESALSGGTPVGTAGIQEIHRALQTGGRLTVYADTDAGPDHDPGRIAALLRENGFDNVITHPNNHLIGHPARYRMQRVTATKPPACRSAAAPTPVTRPPADPSTNRGEPDRTPQRPPVAVRLADLITHKDPGHTSGLAEHASRQILHDPSHASDILAELRATLTNHLSERLARNSVGAVDFEIERWLRHAAGGAFQGAAMGRLARAVIDHLRCHATLVPEDDGTDTIAGLPAAGGPGTLLRRAGRLWVQQVVSDFWDEIADDPAHRLHPLMRQTAAAILNTNTAGVVAFSHRQRALATGELSRTSHTVIPPATNFTSTKVWWLGSFLGNWDVAVSYLIAHGIALQQHHRRRPTPAEFGAVSADLLRRTMNTSAMGVAAVIPFHTDLIALSLERWENAPGNADPYAIHRRSPIFRAVTDNTAKAGIGEPPRRAGHCSGSIALHLPAGPETAALRELFLAAGVQPPDDTEFTAVAALVAFGHRLAMDTLYPNMPPVTVLDDDVLEGYRRLDVQGFERQYVPSTPAPGDAAQEPFLLSRNPTWLIKAAQNVARRWE